MIRNPKTIGQILFSSDEHMQSFYIHKSMEVYSYDLITRQIVVNTILPLLSPGRYEGTIDVINENLYLNIGLNRYVLYDKNIITAIFFYSVLTSSRIDCGYAICSNI